MPNVYARVYRGVRDHFPARASEWVLGFALTSWGALLLRPGAMFDTSPAFRTMASMASENVWGWAAIAIGISRLFALILNGTFPTTWYGRFSPHVRGVMSILSMFVWLSITLGLYRVETENTGVAIYFWLMVLDVWNCGRAFRDAGALDEGLRNGAA